MDFEDVLKFACTNSNEMVRSYATIVQLELYVIFQKWNEAQSLLLKLKDGDLRPFVPGLYHLVRFSFLEGLISLKAAQLSTSCIERRKWEQRANRIIKMIKTWLQKGNVNVVHTYHILTAEYHVLKKNKAQAEERALQQVQKLWQGMVRARSRTCPRTCRPLLCGEWR